MRDWSWFLNCCPTVSFVLAVALLAFFAAPPAPPRGEAGMAPGAPRGEAAPDDEDDEEEEEEEEVEGEPEGEPPGATAPLALAVEEERARVAFSSTGRSSRP